MTTAFWIASDEYIEEAQRSSASLHRHMPDVKRILISTEHGISPGFDIHYHIPRGSALWYLYSTECMRFATQNFADRSLIYLDTDTRVIAPFYDAVEVARRFNLCACHAPGRWTGKSVMSVPHAFPELNIGVVLFNIAETTQNFVSYWYNLYKDNVELYGNNDQGPLRDALWAYPDFRFYVLPPEYNVRPFGTFLRGRARVLHGRGNLDQWEREVNASEGMRLWKPG